MLLLNVKVLWKLQCNIIFCCNTSYTLKHLFTVQLKFFTSLLWLFDAIGIYIKNLNLKKWENEDDFNLLLNEPNFMRNELIIPMLLVMAFFKVTHQKVYLLVNIRALTKVWIPTKGIFPTWSLKQIFEFFLTRISYSQITLKRIRPIFQIFWCYLNTY